MSNALIYTLIYTIKSKIFWFWSALFHSLGCSKFLQNAVYIIKQVFKIENLDLQMLQLF